MSESFAHSANPKSSVPSGPDAEPSPVVVQQQSATSTQATTKEEITDANKEWSNENSSSISSNDDAVDSTKSTNNHVINDPETTADENSTTASASINEIKDNKDPVMSSEDKEKEKAVAEAVALTAAAVAAITGAMKDEEKKKSKSSNNNTVRKFKNKTILKKTEKDGEDSVNNEKNSSSIIADDQIDDGGIGEKNKDDDTTNDLVDPEIQKKDSNDIFMNINSKKSKEFAKKDNDSQDEGISNSTATTAGSSVTKKHIMKPPPQLKDLESSDNLKNWRDFMRFDDAKTKLINEPSKGKYIYVCALCNKEFFYNSRNGPRTIVSHLKKHREHYQSSKNNNSINDDVGNLNGAAFGNNSFINAIHHSTSSLDILSNPEAAAMEVISKLTDQDIDSSKISMNNDGITSNSNNSNSNHFDQLDESKLDSIVKNASKKWRSHFVEIHEPQQDEQALATQDKDHDEEKNNEEPKTEEQKQVSQSALNKKKEIEEEEEEEPHQQQESKSEKEQKKKRKRNHATNNTINTRKSVTKYKCKYCDRQFTYCSRNGPTSLIRHLENLHKPQFLNPASSNSPAAFSNNNVADNSSSSTFNTVAIDNKTNNSVIDTDKDDINCMLYIAKAARFWRLHYDKNEEKTDALVLEKEHEIAEKDQKGSSTPQRPEKESKVESASTDSKSIEDLKEIVTKTTANSTEKPIVITKGPIKRKSRYSPEVYDCKFCGSSKVYLSRNGPKTLSRHLEKHHKKELLQIDENLLSTVSYEIFKRSNENFV